MAACEIYKDQDGKLQGFGQAGSRAWARFRKAVAELGPGELIRFEWFTPRSGRFHRRHFALLATVFDLQEQFAKPEQLRMWTQVGAGHCDFVPGPTGRMVALPRSIAYHKLDDTEFRELHEATVDFLRQPHAYRYLWPHLADDVAADMIESALREFER